MEPEKIKKILFIISLIGIILLLFISQNIKPTSVNTNSTLKINQYVKIAGKVIQEKSYEDFTVLTLQDKYGKIPITCNCKKLINKTLEVIGKVNFYNRIQIQADKIILSSN